MRATRIHRVFLPANGPWESYASQQGLRSVLDPADAAGLKNAAIDLLHRTAIDRALCTDRLGTVLDFGCGTGRMIRHLAARARRLIGVDITGARLRRAAQDTSAPHAHWSRIDGVRLPLRDASVDHIVSVYVLRYAVRDPSAYAAVLRELARVLTPGGRTVCIEQVARGSAGPGSVGQAASCADYLDPARDLFDATQTHPVRVARPGDFELQTVLRKNLPETLRRVAARLSLWRTRQLGQGALSGQPYADWLFSFDAAASVS